MKMAFRTHVGCVRNHNEDSIRLTQLDAGFRLAIVADGMGGHQAGDVASKEAVQIIEQDLRQNKLDVSTEEKKEILLKAIGKANQKVYTLALENSQFQGMGTTVIAAIVDAKEVVLGHVGDSRAYMLHKEGLYQLTVDHSYVEFLKKHGQITAEEAETHPQRNMILRAVGTNEEVEVDLVNTPWYENDILLLCSDGLTTMIDENEIGNVLTKATSLEEKADTLLTRALDAGGKDNISLILLKNM